MSERFENVTVNLADNVAVSNYIKRKDKTKE